MQFWLRSRRASYFLAIDAQVGQFKKLRRQFRQAERGQIQARRIGAARFGDALLGDFVTHGGDS